MAIQVDYNSNSMCANSTHPLYNNISHTYTLSYGSPLYARYVVSLLFLFMSLFHVSLSLTIFIILHGNDRVTRIKGRSIVLVLITAASTTMHSFIAMLPGMRVMIPSWILMPCTYFLIALSITPIPIRLFNFYGRYVFFRAITQISISEGVDYNDRLARKTAIGIEDKNANKDDSTAITPLPQLNEYNTVPSAAEAAEAIVAVTQTQYKDKDRNRVISPREMLFLRFISSPLAQLFLFVASLVPLVIAIIMNYINIPQLDPELNCMGVTIPDSDFIIQAGYGIVTIILAIIGAYLVRDFKDPLEISKETRLMCQYGGIFAVVSFLLDSYVTDIPVAFTFDYLVSIGVNLMLFTVTGYQIYLAVYEYYSGFSISNLLKLIKESLKKKNRVENMGADEITSNVYTQHKLLDHEINQQESSNSSANEAVSPKALKHMLDNPKEVEEFEKFLIGEFSVENLRMYIECRKWEEIYFDSTDSQRRARAKKIIELFVKNGSIFEVNIPNDIREEIKQACENKDTQLDRHLFSKSQKEMLGIMYGAFRRYQRQR